MEDFRKFLITQPTNLSDSNGDLKTTILEFLHEKLALLLHFIASTISNLSQEFDRIVPPETRSETIHRWIRIALTRALPILLVGFVVLKCCCCCCRRGRGYGRMMVAPGRGGARMPRASFEASPRDYFVKLRARKPLVY